MATITVEKVPPTFIKQVGNKVDFKTMLGLSWDGMDWLQDNQVIPTKEDIKAIKKAEEEIKNNNLNNFIDGEKFLLNLISKKNV